MVNYYKRGIMPYMKNIQSEIKNDVDKKEIDDGFCDISNDAQQQDENDTYTAEKIERQKMIRKITSTS